MNVDYLKGDESPTAELVDNLFAALDAKLTTLLGGRSFFLAQTAVMPSYLIGKAFFFTAGPAVYATRVPGYIETNTSLKPVARPYNHAQFMAAQAAAVLQPATVRNVLMAPGNGGLSYLLNDVLTMAGGTVAAGGQPCSIQVTLKDAAGQIVAWNIVNHGSYTVPPPTPNQATGGHGGGALFNLDIFQYDVLNKVAPIVRLTGTPATTAYAGLPQASDVGLYEWSLAAHSVLHQSVRDLRPVRYYLQDGTTTPEKHLRFALAEIIIEGVPSVTIEKTWDKYACFRIHNLNSHPATITFEGGTGGYTVALDPFECATVRRDWSADAGTGHYKNYRSGKTYFFTFEGGDPRCYWFFPTSGGVIGGGGRAANSMQANNLTNPAILLDWIQYFQRTPDATTTFAGWKDDPSVQCDIYDFYKKLPGRAAIFGDPSDPATLVGDLLHHKGDIKILRASLTKREPVTGNPVITWDKVTFNGYATIVADFAKHKLAVTENAAGNLVVTNIDRDNDVFLIPVGTNLFKQGDAIDGSWLGLIFGWPDSPYVNNGSWPTKKGIPLLSPGHATYTPGVNGYAVTIESAIFESVNPEQPWLVVPTYPPLDPSSILAVTPPQLIQQPIETISTPQKTWYDIYQPAAGGFGNGFFQWTVNGQPQTTLNWNTNARGLLTLPTILDGGSGYAVGDGEQLTGGTGDPAVIIVTAVNGGQVTGISIGFVGNYTVAPPNPNFPNAIWPTDDTGRVTPRGYGLKLGGINIPIKAMAGIHKTTVADLLKLDWWGDPRVGNQNGPYVALEKRKLTLTPQGLVLTFTEIDSPLPGDTALQPASLPTWASGKRGIPRQRAIRFRGHGWGFVGGPADTETVGLGGAAYTISVPPSAKSGMVSPRIGRFEVNGNYRGEGVAPSGRDWSWWATTVKENTLKLLTRVKACTLALGTAANARFWRAAKIDNAANLLVQIGGSPAPYFFELWKFNNYAGENAPDYPVNAIAMALLPEMYNNFARAVNALTTGTPLQWQCLRFNVGGLTTNLDPQNTISILRNDNTPMVFVAGAPLPVFDSLGRWVSQDTGTGAAFYTGPRPLDQFGAFDQGSLYERLCNQLGIVIQSEKDLPGGLDKDGKSAEFSYFQGRVNAPAIYYDFATAIGGGQLAQEADPDGLGSGDPYPVNATSFDQYQLWTTTTLSTELLSSAALLAGRATGSKCLGTYDPADWQATLPSSLPGIPGPTGSTTLNPPVLGPGEYLVASDGSGNVMTSCTPYYYWDGVVHSAMVLGGALAGITNVWSSPPATGLAYYLANGDATLNLRTAFTGYRWVSVEAIRQVVLKFGFPFLWAEVCTPLVLKYFEDPTRQESIGGLAVGNSQWTAQTAGYTRLTYVTVIINVRPDGRGLSWQDRANADLAALPPTWVAAFINGALPGHGTVTRFCATSDKKLARWKSGAPPASSAQMVPDGPVGFGIGFGVPGEICHLKSRANLSPLFRVIGASSGIGLIGPFHNAWSPSLGVSLQPGYINTGVKPSTQTDFPRLAVQYVGPAEIMETTYTEGTLLDQRQVLAFNIYSSFPIAPLPVLCSGVYAWERPKDYWSNIDTAYAASGQGGGYPDPLPWSFVPPAPAYTQAVMDYFDGNNQNGLTIFAAKPDQRYWLCFSTAAFDLNAVTFGDQNLFF